MKLAMRDENHIRMDTGEGNYMLVSGEKTYMVTQQDGQWTVMDMDQLAGMMERYGGAQSGTLQDVDRYQSSFKKTARSETIAGYKGTVYIVETRDESGNLIDKSEVVFSKHKDIKRVNQAWMTIAMRMGNIIGQKTSLAVDRATQKAEKSGYGGFLRVDEMVLKNVSKPSLNDSYYEMPDGAKMVDLKSSRSMESGESDQQGEGSAYIEDVGEEAGDAAKDEVKRNTVRKVKEGVGGLFKKVFD
jgi:hypothetical protein